MKTFNCAIQAALLLISFLALASCDSDPNDEAQNDSGTEPQEPLVTARIAVPTDFGGQATEGLAISFWSELPTTLQTLPEGIGAFGSSYILVEPEIDENTPLDIEILPISLATRQPIEGSYYINITLFVEGGGFSAQLPVVDVDYSQFITTSTQVGTEPLDLGEVQLVKFQGPPA